MNWELKRILSLSKGKVVLLIDGERKAFVSGQEAIGQVEDKYRAGAIEAEGDVLVVTMEEDHRGENEADSEFVREYVERFGKEPNMFDGV